MFLKKANNNSSMKRIQGYRGFGKKGTVLILVLWVLSFLSVFALSIGISVRQNIQVLSRLDKRAKISLIATAGIHKARAIINTTYKVKALRDSAQSKKLWFNNRPGFRKKKVGRGFFDVTYIDYDEGADQPRERFGVVDEGGKINVNHEGRSVLKRLIKDVLGENDEDAGHLANMIIDWRRYGESEITGFFSDEYYENLEFPYVPKKSDFEVLDELLLVEGVTRDIYKRLINFTTIYGDGKVNINTAPRQVLSALGLSETLVGAILFARRGEDEIEFTEDDFVFHVAHNIGLNLDRLVKLEDSEMQEIDALIKQNKLKTGLSLFRLRSQGQLESKGEKVVIECVFNAEDDKIIYWHES